MTRSIRSRIFMVVVLGLATAALSLTALIRAISISNAQRLERAHETVGEELETLAASHTSADGQLLPAPPDMTVVGMHGGYWSEGQGVGGVPETWRALLKDTLRDGLRDKTRVVREGPIEGMTVVVAAQPAGGDEGHMAWAALLVRPPAYLRSWKLIVLGLMITTTLLVTSAVFVLVTMNQSVAELAKSLAASRSEGERLNKELEQSERLAALGRVVAGVAHEVRNPLAAIKLRLDLTAATPSLPAPVIHALSSATAEIERLDRLVADLLVVAGRQLGPKKSMELSAFVQARVEALQPWSQERHIRVEVRGSGSAVADPDSLTRAIDNLLRNAVEAAPAGSVVEVSVENGEDTVRIKVDDAGTGVPAERTQELFEPFFTTKSGGMGLGLAISRAIARAHGGDVTYARLEGLTRFELSLKGSSA